MLLFATPKKTEALSPPLPTPWEILYYAFSIEEEISQRNI